jgi:hypothetical protein
MTAFFLAAAGVFLLVLGYVRTWKRRPARDLTVAVSQGLAGTAAVLTWIQRLSWACIALAAVPVIGLLAGYRRETGRG